MSAMSQLDATIRGASDLEQRLVVGQTYTATTTAKNRGQRTYRTITFTAARESIEIHFITPSDDGPGEDRIFTQHWEPRLNRFDSWPELVVSGSIQAVSK